MLLRLLCGKIVARSEMTVNITSMMSLLGAGRSQSGGRGAVQESVARRVLEAFGSQP